LPLLLGRQNLVQLAPHLFLEIADLLLLLVGQVQLFLRERRQNMRHKPSSLLARRWTAAAGGILGAISRLCIPGRDPERGQADTH
jgi:hypothetical protein